MCDVCALRHAKPTLKPLTRLNNIMDAGRRQKLQNAFNAYDYEECGHIGVDGLCLVVADFSSPASIIFILNDFYVDLRLVLGAVGE